jgi:hypothetical protein
MGTDAMSRNHNARVQGAVDRVRPVSPSSESGSTACGRSSSCGDALPTPTGASVADAEAVGVADVAGVTAGPPTTAGVTGAAAVGAGVAAA